MPFTPTHVLAILPIAALGRHPLPFSALAIGSMIPDLPLFVPLWPDYGTTHSISGVFTACLPLGLACFLIFQLAMKRPLFALLPEAIQRRCASLSRPRVELTPKFLSCASMAVVIGASTHLLWDSFTHGGRWGARLFPGLDETALTFQGHAIPRFKLLQYGSTLIGLPCLVLLLAIWLTRREPEGLGGRPSLSRTSKVAACLVAIAIPTTAASAAWGRDGSSSYERLCRAIAKSGLALMVITLSYCLAFPMMERRMTRTK
jgi:hypothetical protein